MEQFSAMITRRPVRCVSTTRPPALLATLLCVSLLIQCKPADEPPRDPARATNNRPALVTTAQDKPEGTIRLVAPERARSEADAASPPAPTSALEAEGAVPAGEPENAEWQATLARAKALGVDKALIASLEVPATPADQQLAAEANRKGLKRHRKLDLKAAIQAYEAGLSAWPGHLFSRYNLACAHALSGNREDALRHLAVVSVHSTSQAADRMRAARVDPDFESLLKDETFRALTHYASVEVSWSPSIEDAQAAVALVDRLRRENIPAHEGREWRKDLPETTLYVAIDHAIAQRVGDEILASKATPTKKVDSRFLNENRPIVLVLGSGAPSDPTSTDSASIDSMIGQRVTAKQDGVEEDFLLKPTGFFVWNVRSPDGSRIEKSGRYNLKGQALHLDFQMTTTKPGNPPQVTVERGRRENHTLTLEGSALLIGSKRFTR